MTTRLGFKLRYDEVLKPRKNDEEVRVNKFTLQTFMDHLLHARPWSRLGMRPWLDRLLLMRRKVMLLS